MDGQTLSKVSAGHKMDGHKHCQKCAGHEMDEDCVEIVILNAMCLWPC